MFKRFFKNIGPHIVPELKILGYYILPLSLLSMFLFVAFFANNTETNMDPYVLGFLLSIGGIYVTRVVSWLVFNRLTGLPEAHADIYSDETDKK